MRYRRDQMTVHTDDGPRDGLGLHRPPGEAGPTPTRLPAERIIDGATASWAAAELGRLLTPLGSVALAPAAVTASQRLRRSRFRACSREPGVIEVSRLRSRFGFFAIHGGGLEEMTDVIAERAAEAAGASVYVLRHPDRYPHHLPSAHFVAAESARLAEFLDHVDVTVSLHGYGRDRPRHPTAGRRPQPRAGRPRGRTSRVARLSRHHRPRRHSAGASWAAPTEPGEPDPLRRNTTGTPDSGQGDQPAQPAAGADGLSPVTAALVQGLAAAARAWQFAIQLTTIGGGRWPRIFVSR